jgi:hypothetical protein
VESNGDTTKLSQPITTNGNGVTLNLAEPGKKRAISEVEDAEHQAKRSRIHSNGKGNGVAHGDTIVLDDSADGAILIDDD